MKVFFALFLSISTAFVSFSEIDEIGKSLENSALNPVKIMFKKGIPKFSILQNGSGNAVIVIPNESEDFHFPWMTFIPQIKKGRSYYHRGVAAVAAAEFQKYLEAASGVKLPIFHASETPPAGKNIIYIGMSGAASKAGFSNKGIKPEGFKINIGNKAMAILGAALPTGDKRGHIWDGAYGVIFGVYDFLERFAGIRFYYPGTDGVVVPQIRKLDAPALTYSDYPRYERRQMYGWATDSLPSGKEHDWMRIALQYRSGGNGKHGANIVYQHQPSNMVKNGMSPALTANGKANSKHPQMPCFGSPEAAEKFMSTVNAAIDGKITSEEYDGRGGVMPTEEAIGFSPPDHPIECSCPYCKKLFSPGPFYQQGSRIYGQFIKSVAEKIKKEHPNATFYILPYYNYVGAAQGLKLPDNTFAMVCMMYGSNAYQDPKIKQCTARWIRDWKRIAGKKVHVYMYPNWPGASSGFPRQYYHNLKKFINDFKNDVNGAFSCGPKGSGVQGLQGGMYALNLPSVYCLFRLMWNPDYDVDAGIDDLCEKMYGPAGEAMRRIITLGAKAWENADISDVPQVYDIGPYRAGSIPPEVGYEKIYTPEIVEHLKKDLAAAEQAAGTDNIYRRRVDLFGNALKLFFMEYDEFKNPVKRSAVSAEAFPIKTVAKTSDKFSLPDWKNIRKNYFVKAYRSHTKTPEVKTWMQAAYDRGGLLIRLHMDEPQMNKIVNGGRAGGELYQKDCVEVFLEYAPGSVYHLSFNSDGTQLEQFQGKGPVLRTRGPVKSIVKGSDFWEADIYVPFASLDASVEFDPAKPLKANFIRSRVVAGRERQVSRWSTLHKKAHNDKETFGELLFKVSNENEQ